ncbi:FAD-binding oxidoreductase [Thermoactinospora rubra]|uniref:FAD-binding oxidoreductase n=1 Tax=Thermoactinospora rubra TaxID=1088767 RepID=UPI000A0FEA08|nr:FAD-binding oxidoreductase [Thermoactinospora rubra]
MTSIDTELNQLADRLAGELVLPGDPGYDRARRVWNGAVDRYPAAIVRCRRTADVVAALRFARERGFLVAVRGGGHSIPGYSTCDDGIVLDLGPMKGVTVDPVRRVAVAEAGLTWGELDAATQRHGLAVTGGEVSDTGIAGLTLGGGIGWLKRVHGLTCDNLLAAELVTADGQVLHAGAEEHPELFWGLRGGGGNFGVVTRFTYRLHPVGPLFAGAVMHPGDRAPQALRFVRDLAAAAPDELSLMAALVTAPPEPFVPPEMRGRPMVLLAGCHVGPVEDGERALAPLRRFGPPPVDLFGVMPYVELQRLADPMNVPGRPIYVKSEMLGPLDDAALEVAAARAAEPSSPYNQLLLHHMGGAVRRVPADATAFGHRDAEYLLTVAGAWEDPAGDPQPHVRWARDSWQALRPWSRGTYVNHLGEEGEDRVRQAYPAGTYDRLVALKRTYDPENVFRLNQNIRP